MKRWLKRSVQVVVACGALAFGFSEDGPAGDCTPSLQGPSTAATYHYRMKGKVRLLLFWVGKDNVGGGTITLLQSGDPKGNCWAEGVEVLFGSIPERVPGRINRWGYAEEWAHWQRAVSKPGKQLIRTVFQGFMRHSEEESISEVRANAYGEQSKNDFLYDAMLATVTPQQAISELRVFAEKNDFDFRRPERVQQSYQEQAQNRPPHKRKQLENRTHLYTEPYGFLTAVRETLREVSTRFGEGQSHWSRARPVRTYVNSARTYRLRVQNIRYHRTFALERGDGNREKNSVFPSVAEVDFEVKNLEKGSTHDFSIWFPLQGPLQGVPVKIQDRPRWWLNIELYLDMEENPQAAVASKQ